MIDSSKRLKELYVILQYLTDDDFNKIPKETIDEIKANMDNNYEFDIDTSKPLYEQKIHNDTLALLANISAEYLLNEEEKILMRKIYNFNF